MPVIHHPVLEREMEVSEQAADIFTTNPRVPWVRGPLPKKRTRSTANNNPSPEGDTTPSTEED